MAGRGPGHLRFDGAGWMAGTTPYRMHRSGNRSAAAIATSSWPGLSGPSVAARAGIGGPDKPGHDDGEKLAAIEQVFDFMGLHGCSRKWLFPKCVHPVGPSPAMTQKQWPHPISRYFN